MRKQIIGYQLLIASSLFLYNCSSDPNLDKESCYYEPFNVENQIVNQFLAETSYFIEDDYSFSLVPSYLNEQTTYRKDIPAYLTLTWNNHKTNIIARSLTVYDSAGDVRNYDLSVTDTSFVLYNLVPNRRYCIEVADYSLVGKTIIYSKTIETTGALRMLYVEGDRTSNFRDLGGWQALNNGVVRYEKLIRGSEVFYRGSDEITVNTQGISTLIDQLHVQVELDFGDYSSNSPLESYGVELFHGNDYQIRQYYVGLEDMDNRRKYGNCLRAIIQQLKAGKTIYFHCNYGADRTGTLAVFIEGLLGVSEADISKDFELTSFSSLSTIRTRSFLKEMINYIKQNFVGSTFDQKIYNMSISSIDNGGLGLSVEEVKSLREIMIDYE